MRFCVRPFFTHENRHSIVEAKSTLERTTMGRTESGPGKILPAIIISPQTPSPMNMPDSLLSSLTHFLVIIVYTEYIVYVLKFNEIDIL